METSTNGRNIPEVQDILPQLPVQHDHFLLRWLRGQSFSHQAVVALRKDDDPLQAAQDDLPQILQDPLQHRFLTDVSENAEAGSQKKKPCKDTHIVYPKN
ncbi:hypothetical protein CCH79_00013227 [Gambusia affinis]|uniref:Uncharacterized protein n=1 Tax=Gambusia affinis TaxID=33528 RepID=A0A315V1H8_GAMAF|nr:hypothetical protein CCH79_00013227 [Gambusia affinis]